MKLSSSNLEFNREKYREAENACMTAYNKYKRTPLAKLEHISKTGKDFVDAVFKKDKRNGL